MKDALDSLKRFIQEEVDRLVRRSAGFGGSAGIGGSGRGRGSAEQPPPGLGDSLDGDEDVEKKEFEQLAVKVDRNV